MLLRYAKLAGGLRLLIATTAPLAVTAISTISVRTAAYLIGFGLSSILSIWLPVVLSLVALTGFFGGNSDTSICDAYRAEMRRIEEHNKLLQADYDKVYEAYALLANAWSAEYLNYSQAFWNTHQNDCVAVCNSPGWWMCYYCQRDLIDKHDLSAPIMPDPPPLPDYQVYDSGCGSESSPPYCPDGKKVWLQVIWTSPRGNASDVKGCFIVAYSQDSKDLPANIEYNPYLKEAFVKSRVVAYDSIIGNKLAGVDTSVWKDLDSRKGWDRGYWAAEVVDSECRGWRPGWSLKIK